MWMIFTAHRPVARCCLDMAVYVVCLSGVDQTWIIHFTRSCLNMDNPFYKVNIISDRKKIWAKFICYPKQFQTLNNFSPKTIFGLKMFLTQNISQPHFFFGSDPKICSAPKFFWNPKQIWTQKLFWSTPKN